ncbi:hypothetical protein [Ehrlichia muris]|uniref:Uncharacterized protein n=1 Tax=Ehrlichia muris AS145 TaxID=1423892 RepID=V9RA46_9RICK|nr:hypothetical protein [Ehrlichia muris]AHC39654.1 hypothetical protein EMUR_00035 [Ehrlichia muris AS145]
MDIDNNKVDVNTQSKFQNLLDILVRTIWSSSKDSNVVEVEDHSGTHQEGDKTIFQPSSEPAISVVTEEEKEISEIHLESNNPKVSIKEDLHADVVSDNLDQAASVVTEETSAHREENETISQPSLEPAISVVTEEEVSGQNLLDILVRTIWGSSKDSNVVEVEDHFGTHQEENETISQPSSEPAASVVIGEEKEISETHFESDNPKVSKEENLHADVVSDNLDQAVPVVAEVSSAHQEENETISQPSLEPAISVVIEEEKEISETHLESDNPKVSKEENLHADVVSDNLDQAVPVVAEVSSAHQEENETISQPSSEPAISVVTEEEKEISETHLESDNPKVSKEEDLHADVVSDNLDQAISVVTEEEVSGQNLLDILVRAISGSSKDSNVVEVENHSGTHQEGDKTISQPSSEPAASVVTEETSAHREENETISQPSSEPAISVVTEEEKEISETHLESDNPKVSKEEDLHADVVSDNLDQAISVVTEEEVSGQNLLDILVRAISGSSKDSNVVEVEDHSGTHQEGDKTISQPSSEPAISVVTEEEVSGQNLLDILVRAISGSSKDSNVVEVENHSGTHQEGDKTISQPSSEPAASVVTEETSAHREENETISQPSLESAISVVTEEEVSGQNLLDILVRAISGSSKDSNVVEVENHSGTHQEGDKTISQPSLESAASVVTEEEKEISETHLESDNPKVSKEEDLHADVVSDNLDQADSVVTEETSAHREENETISQPSSEPAISVVTEEEVSGQNLLDILVRTIWGSSKDSNVVEVEDHFGTHQEENETISQPSSEPAASVVIGEEKEISETHFESDNPKVSKEENLHADVVSDNLDQAVPVVAEVSSAHQEENETISQPSLEPAISVVIEEEKEISETHLESDNPKVSKEENLHADVVSDNLDQAVPVVAEVSSAHQEENETISQPSLEPAISVVIEEEKEISETHLESDNPKVSKEEDLHADVVSDNLDQADSVVTEETSAHREENETISQPSSEPAISVVTEEEVSGQNLLDILVRAISGSSKDSNVVAVEDHFGTHQEGDKTISQPSSEPAASVVTEEEVSGQNLLDILVRAISGSSKDSNVVEVEDHFGTHQEENETISQPSLESAISVVTEEEVSGQNLLDILVRAISGSSKDSNVVEVEDHFGTHQEENETISQPSLESAISVVIEEEKEISETYQGENNPKFLVEEDLHYINAIVNDDKTVDSNLLTNDTILPSVNKILCPLPEVMDEEYVYDCQVIKDYFGSLLHNDDVCCCFKICFVEYNYFVTQADIDNNTVNSII